MPGRVHKGWKRQVAPDRWDSSGGAVPRVPLSGWPALPTPHFSRRDCLHAASATFLGALSLARSAAAGASGSGPSPNRPRPAKHCILVYLLGGPPHQDLWDLKPHAPAEIRGAFQPIETVVPGIAIGEHLPRLAQHADRYAIVRSLSYANNDHPFMTYYTLTGRISSIPLGANTVLPPSRTDDPHMGAVVSCFKHDDPTTPGYVALPEVRVRMGAEPVAGGGRSGFLGPRHEPLAINDDPRQPLPLLRLPEDVGAGRLAGRERLLAILDGRSARSLRTREYETTRGSALGLTRASSGNGLFELDAEPAALRAQYGEHRFGQSLLLARRLVERGVSFVGVHFNYMTRCDGWDTHKNNFACLKDELLPMLDQGLSSLLDDLAQRGMLDETLVVTMGEFGRTPRINADAGRDHWGLCGSAVFAGGGIRGGQVIGASDKIGAMPTDSPVGPPDVVATIYHALGLDPHELMHDQQNRPLPLSTGSMIRGLF